MMTSSELKRHRARRDFNSVCDAGFEGRDALLALSKGRVTDDHVKAARECNRFKRGTRRHRAFDGGVTAVCDLLGMVTTGYRAFWSIGRERLGQVVPGGPYVPLEWSPGHGWVAKQVPS